MLSANGHFLSGYRTAINEKQQRFSEVRDPGCSTDLFEPESWDKYRVSICRNVQ